MAADKHKIWLISCIVIVILIIGFIFIYPNVKKGLAGQAVGTGTSNDPFILSSCVNPDGWQSGKTYKLGADVSTTENKCFSISNVNNIIFDCDGHKIIGGSTDPKGNTLAAGIYFSKVNSSTIKNCLITSFPKGIYLSVTKQNVLSNNVLGGNKQGIYLLTSPGTTFNQNIACNNELKNLFCLYSSALSGSDNLFNADKVTCTTLVATAYSSCGSEICTDKLDNDGDFGADCKDNDCGTDPSCDAACTPSCADKTCGTDGCGGSCGTCSSDKICSTIGNCIDIKCASDANCDAGFKCVDSKCQDSNKCYDPDNTYTPYLGLAQANKNTFDINSLNQKNTVMGLLNGKVYSETDKCSGEKVIEIYCKSQTDIGWASFACPNQQPCQDGVCKPTTGCTDPDVDNPLSQKTTVTYGSESQTDSCNSDTKINEYSCLDEGDGQISIDLFITSCPAGTTCQDGACISKCAGKTCGDDGYGGSCGTCAALTKCQDNICKNKDNFLCTDTDNGKNYTNKGTLYSYNFPDGKEDECDLTTGKLKERFCLKNELSTYTYSCPSGFKCDLGACIPSTSEVCNDGIDNDLDQNKDCGDPDCWGGSLCKDYYCQYCGYSSNTDTPVCTIVQGQWSCVECAVDTDCTAGKKCENNKCVQTDNLDIDADGVTDSLESTSCKGKGTVNAVYTSGNLNGCPLGDLDGDGDFDDKDAISLGEAYVNSLIAGDTLWNGFDLNCDGKVDEKDAILIGESYVNKLLGTGGDIVKCPG